MEPSSGGHRILPLQCYQSKTLQPPPSVSIASAAKQKRGDPFGTQTTIATVSEGPPVVCTNNCRYFYEPPSPPSYLPSQQQQQHQQQQHPLSQQHQHQHHPQQSPSHFQHAHTLHHSHQVSSHTLDSPHVKSKTRPNRNMHQQYPDDLDTIEFCSVEDEVSQRLANDVPKGKQKLMMDPQVRWSRNNIAVTMERFQPISSPTSEKDYGSHQDYSYAYYEPGAVMCHSNIPTPDEVIAGPSFLPPPNSMRALLLKTKEKSKNKHTYTTRYGTQENIYEDVSDDKHGRLVSSEQSLSSRQSTKKEFQHILNNHYRVLEELNLSVEELLMSSSSPPSETVNFPDDQQNGDDELAKQFASIELKDDIRSPVSEHAVGEDSGFSGSSSGASYIGSLRHYKTAITRSLRRSSAPNCTNGGTVYGSCRTARFPQDPSQYPVIYNDPKMMSKAVAAAAAAVATEKTQSRIQRNVHSSPQPKAGFKFLMWSKRS